MGQQSVQQREREISENIDRADQDLGRAMRANAAANRPLYQPADFRSLTPPGTQVRINTVMGNAPTQPTLVSESLVYSNASQFKLAGTGNASDTGSAFGRIGLIKYDGADINYDTQREFNRARMAQSATSLSSKISTAVNGAVNGTVDFVKGQGHYAPTVRDNTTAASALSDLGRGLYNGLLGAAEGILNLQNGALPGFPDYEPRLDPYRANYDTPVFGSGVEVVTGVLTVVGGAKAVGRVFKTSVADKVLAAELAATQELVALETSINGAHFVKRHGSGTSIEDQLVRAKTGLTPDGVQKGSADASRFLRDRDMLEGLRRAEAQRATTGRNSIDIKFDRTIGEGYLQGGGTLRTTDTARFVFRDNQIFTIYPNLRAK